MLGLAVPLNLAVLADIWSLSKAGEDQRRAALDFSAHTVATAVDADLEQYVVLAKGLASSPALLEDKLDAFQDEARRAFEPVENAWIVVADPSGQELMNTIVAAGQPLPHRTPEAIADQKLAFDTRNVVISDMRMGAVFKHWIVAIEVPVLKNGAPFRSLAVIVNAKEFVDLLTAQKTPENWIAAIVDRKSRVMARVPEAARDGASLIGVMLPEQMRQPMALDGIFESPSLEGELTVNAHAHSKLSGWAATVAIKKAELQTAAWRGIGWLGLLGGGISLLSVLFAASIARSVARPIAELRVKAAKLVQGGQVELRPGTPEVEEVWKSLQNSVAARDASEQAVRKSEEHFRILFEQAVDGIFVADRQGCYTDANMAACRMLGYTRAELLALRLADVLAASDVGRLSGNMVKLISGGANRREWNFRRKDGSFFIGEIVGQELPDGQLQGILRDVTLERLSADHLRESERRLQLALDAARAGIWESTPSSGEFIASDRALRLYGLEAGTAMTQASALAAVEPEDRPIIQEALRQTLNQGTPYRAEYRVRQADGSLRWLFSQGDLRPDLAPGKLIGLVQDITERKAREQQIQLLLREVNHRSKNLLGLVQSIARQTAGAGDKTYVSRFSERVQSLAAVQDLLTRNEWLGTDLEELIKAQLAYFKDLIGSRIVVTGPQLNVTPVAAQNLGMAIHELTTNASKYGALANDAGRIAINWRLTEPGPGQRLQLRWSENGGPTVATPGRQGFGSVVTHSMLKIALSAQVTADYYASGLVWIADCPVAAMLEKRLV